MQKSYENIALLGVVSPVSQGAGTVNTTVIDTSLFEKILFIVKTGVLGTSATVDFDVKADSTSGGSFTTSVTGKAITQLVKATDDSKQVLVEVDANALRAQNTNFRYLRGTVTVGTAASLVDVTVLGFSCTYCQASQFNLASVKEIKG